MVKNKISSMPHLKTIIQSASHTIINRHSDVWIFKKIFNSNIKLYILFLLQKTKQLKHLSTYKLKDDILTVQKTNKIIIEKTLNEF